MGTEPLERKLAAILYADVAGYSRLTGADEEGTHRILSTYLDAITASIDRHNGKVLHFAGDAVLAEFASVVNALTCAVDIQRDLKARNKDLLEERKLRFRIGINLGDVIVDRDEIYGDGVNVAARLESLAEPGGICISDLVRQSVEGKLDLAFKDLGEQSVKNIDKPVRAYRVLLDSATAAKANSIETPALELPDKPSIAVLPFTNLSGDPEQEYFADGVTEDIITGLSKLSGLLVIARNSTFTYKGKPSKVEQISRELGARYVLEGSMQKAAARVRITAQLVDATTGYHLWAERYDRELSDIFALQDDVTDKIVSALKVRLAAGEAERLGGSDTESIEAYDYLLRAKEYFLRFTKEANTEARRMCERALQIDPTYASAFAGLARSHLLDWNQGWSDSPQESLDRAMELAQRAIDLNDSLGYPHAVLGQVFVWRKQHEDAVSEGERAITLEPNDADNHYLQAMTLSWAGRPEQAITLVERAMRLNPKYPGSYLWGLGQAYFGMEHYENAIEVLERANIRNPDFMPTHIYLAASYARLGRQERAEIEREACVRLNPRMTLAIVAELVPYRREPDRQRLLDNMRKAGWSE